MLRYLLCDKNSYFASVEQQEQPHHARRAAMMVFTDNETQLLDRVDPKPPPTPKATV